MRTVIDYCLPHHKRHFQKLAIYLRDNGHEVIETSTYYHRKQYNYFTIEDANHTEYMTLHGKYENSDKGRFSYFLRCLIDYCHYQESWANGFVVLRNRSYNSLKHAGYIANLPAKAVQNITDEIKSHSSSDINKIKLALCRLDRALGYGSFTKQHVDFYSADTWIFTQLPFTQYCQTDYLRACKDSGLTTVYIPFSWDNLSTKGFLHDSPDAVFTWNKVQIKELESHDLCENYKAAAVGSPRFSEYIKERRSFQRKISRNKILRIIYMCSSNLISTNEHLFINQWISSIRSSKHEILENAEIYIRPHPKFESDIKENIPESKDVYISSGNSVSDSGSLITMLKSMDVVVATNTSAELEAALAGHVVFTILKTDFLPGISGTKHFQHLADPGEGIKIIANTFEEHINQILSYIDDATVHDQKSIKFCESFIYGGDMTITPEERIREFIGSATDSRNTNSKNSINNFATRLISKSTDLAYTKKFDLPLKILTALI